MTKRSFTIGLLPRPLLALVAVVTALALPAGAQAALKLEIANDNAMPTVPVYVTISGQSFNVPGMNNGEAKLLSEVPQPLEINSIVSGRIFVSYGGKVTEFDETSPYRYDWAELTVTPSPSDVANLTAEDQFGIALRLDTYHEGNHVQGLGSANADTIFEALQKVPGGPAATVRGPSGEILRVLSPAHSKAYPPLGEYVRSMSGQTIQLHTAFFGTPFVNSNYSGTFAPDGSITLTGTRTPGASGGETETPKEIHVTGPELIEDIYTGENTPNNLLGAIRAQLYSGFSAGFWGGRYGNDALNFCTQTTTTVAGYPYCVGNFDQPAFGAARAALSPFPTCDQYAAVIDKYADMYGNPYSDASGRVTVGIAQTGVPEPVDTLRLTILPDSGNAQPETSGNDECGAAAPVPPAAPQAGGSSGPPRGPAAPKVTVSTKLLKKTELRKGKLAVANVSCSAACGNVRAILHKGKRVVARAQLKRAGRKVQVFARPTRPGRALLRAHPKLKLRLDLYVTPAGQPARHTHGGLVVTR